MLQIINEMKWHKLHDLGMHTSHSNCLSHSYFSRAFSLFVCVPSTSHVPFTNQFWLSMCVGMGMAVWVCWIYECFLKNLVCYYNTHNILLRNSGGVKILFLSRSRSRVYIYLYIGYAVFILGMYSIFYCELDAVWL